MNIKDLSFRFTTDDLVSAKDFYTKYFGAEIIFDCGWYVEISFKTNGKKLLLSLMEEPDKETLVKGNHVTVYLKVDDVDKELEKLTQMGLDIVSAIKDNPWGDRSFSVKDPMGNELYIFTETEPTEEYKNAYVGGKTDE